MKNQRGVTLIGMVVVCIVIVIVAIGGLKIAPAYIEYFKVKKAVVAIAHSNPGGTVGDVRRAFQLRAAIEDIDVIGPTDLETTTSVPSLVTSKSFGPITSMSPMAARSWNARRTSPTVPPGLEWAIATTAFLTLKYSMYAGAILRPPMATITMTMQTTTIPIRVTPRWFFMDHLSLKFPDTLQIAEIEPDKKRPSNDILVRNEPPYPAVRRIVAVVAHHEIVSWRYCARHALGIVGAIFTKRERFRERNSRRSIAFLKDGVLDPSERLLELCRVMNPLAVEVIRDLLARLRDPVDRESLVLVDDLVAREAHDPLDVVNRRVLGETEHHHIAPPGLTDAEYFFIHQGEPDAVGELAHQDEVPHQQRRHH